MSDEPDTFALAGENDPSAEKARPVIAAGANPAHPVLPYQSRRTVRTQVEVTDAYFPNRRRDLLAPLVLAGVGGAMMFSPLISDHSFKLFVITSIYLSVKFALMFTLCALLGTLIHFPFGTWASAAIKTLATVAMSDGIVFFMMGTLRAMCFGVLIGLILSVMICTACLYYLFELDPEEVAFTAAVYWFPSLAGGFLIFRLTLWLAGVVL